MPAAAAVSQVAAPPGNGSIAAPPRSAHPARLTPSAFGPECPDTLPAVRLGRPLGPPPPPHTTTPTPPPHPTTTTTHTPPPTPTPPPPLLPPRCSTLTDNDLSGSIPASWTELASLEELTIQPGNEKLCPTRPEGANFVVCNSIDLLCDGREELPSNSSYCAAGQAGAAAGGGGGDSSDGDGDGFPVAAVAVPVAVACTLALALAGLAWRRYRARAAAKGSGGSKGAMYKDAESGLFYDAAGMPLPPGNGGAHDTDRDAGVTTAQFGSNGSASWLPCLTNHSAEVRAALPCRCAACLPGLLSPVMQACYVPGTACSRPASAVGLCPGAVPPGVRGTASPAAPSSRPSGAPPQLDTLPSDCNISPPNGFAPSGLHHTSSTDGTTTTSSHLGTADGVSRRGGRRCSTARVSLWLSRVSSSSGEPGAEAPCPKRLHGCTAAQPCRPSCAACAHRQDETCCHCVPAGGQRRQPLLHLPGAGGAAAVRLGNRARG